jgi:lipopolysaccharide exporter
MSLTTQAITGVKWNGFATGAKIAVQFVSLAVLARLLDPGDFGLMSMAVVITGFAQAFADFGIGNAIIHRQDATRQQLSSLYWLNIAVSFMIFWLIWLAIPLAVTYYQEPRLALVLRWAAVSFLIIPFGQQFQSLLRKELRFKELSLIQISQNTIYALFAIGFALGGFGVMSLVWSHLLQSLVGTILLIGIAVNSHWIPSLHFQKSDLIGFVQFGLFQMGERSLNYLSRNVDYLIIGRLLGSEPLGYYTLAYNLMRIPVIYLNPVIVSVAFPAFARVKHQDDVLRKGYCKILHYISAVTFPMMGGMFVVAPLFVPLVYGQQWLPSVPVVQIFCLLGAVYSLGNPIGSILLAKGRADLGFYLNLFAVIGYGISNLIGSRWGITGVAASSLIFSVLFLLPFDFYLRWIMIRMKIREYLHAIKRPALSVVIMIITILPLYYLLTPGIHSVVALTILVFVGVLVYARMIWLTDYPWLIEVRGFLKTTS